MWVFFFLEWQNQNFKHFSSKRGVLKKLFLTGLLSSVGERPGPCSLKYGPAYYKHFLIASSSGEIGCGLTLLEEAPRVDKVAWRAVRGTRVSRVFPKFWVAARHVRFARMFLLVNIQIFLLRTATGIYRPFTTWSNFLCWLLIN